ncbi:uncharacterized protein I206_104985 [Kwoniella pini CBS 10737]|uniref:Fcf2 pre-rRNA processing C-terminal domain-containing protein n=1 Tax=Kwoniella pini CBS 10737 TaxID=1296096 RepID=A0A1B9I8C4_9TREE|nr:uncharacterized protein I206_02524 [Kwoniella pini CBS 10737]OCF51808.1 hypothetical protein I206_02524 [Kwoniella pini CBS 10737]
MSTPRRSSNTSTPSSSRPTPLRTPATHHKTADELAAEEAAEILHTPTTRLRSAGISNSSLAGGELETGSARALRHRRLNEVREATQESSGKEDSKSTSSKNSEEEEDDASHLLDPSVTTASVHDEDNQDHTMSPSAGLSTTQAFVTVQADAGSDSTSNSEDDSDDGTSLATSSSTESESEEDDEDDSEDDSDDERMNKLLVAAKAAAIAKQSTTISQGKQSTAHIEDDENVLDFDEDQKEKRKDAPIPDLSVPKLPKAHLSFTQDGKAQAFTKLPELGQAGPSRRPMDDRKKVDAPELDDRPYEKELSKREKRAQPRKATTSELWASIPTPRSDLLPQMKRDYQALALANSLDPKRFMKGGSRSDKVPETFAIGTMIDAPRHMRDTTLTKERKYRAGQVVKSLIQDDSTGEYAKRKYGDLQWNRMENGRGKGWKKTKKW